MVDVCEPAYFADDLTLWAESSSVTDACAAVQPQLDVVDKWCRGHVSQSKSVCTLFTRRNVPLDALSLSLGGVRLRADQAPRYLGVQLTSGLRWDAHISAAAAKATATLGAVLKLVRGLGGRSATAPVIVSLYRSLVRPYLEYGSQLWFGEPPRLRACLDAIQRNTLQAASGGCAQQAPKPWKSTSTSHRWNSDGPSCFSIGKPGSSGCLPPTHCADSGSTLPILAWSQTTTSSWAGIRVMEHQWSSA